MAAIDLLKLCLLGWVIGAAGLWIAKVITRVHCTFPRFLLIVTSPILIGLLPLPWFVNYVIAVILMYVLIVKLTDASWFPDAVLMVAIGNIISISIALLYLYKSGAIGVIKENLLSHF